MEKNRLGPLAPPKDGIFTCPDCGYYYDTPNHELGCVPFHEDKEYLPDPQHDAVNHPSHYNQYPVEVIELTEHMNFCRGNVVKYVARAGFKGDSKQELEDLSKALWYLEREIKRLENNE